MKIDFLANYPNLIPIIGRWYNEEWGVRIHGETEQQSIEKLEDYLNINSMPFVLVAIEQTSLLGVAQLKYHEMVDIFPNKEHWLGGVFVAPDHRNGGIGSKLAQEIASRAPSYGVSTLHLQTEQLDGGIYRKLGWQPVQKVNNHGMNVLVMERHLGA